MFKKLYFTYFIIALNFLVFVFTWLNPSLKTMLSLSISSVNGFYYEFFTYAFTHSDFFHFAFNMAMLYAFGFRIEQSIGSFRISFVYMFSIFVVGLFCVLFMFVKMYLFGTSFYFVLGASGSVCALIGFSCHANKVYFKEYFIAVLIMSFFPLLMGVNIAYDAHIFGFLLGYFLSFFKFLR